jgi:hypothetical protein
MPRSSWITSTPSSWSTGRSTTPAVAYSRPPWDIAAASANPLYRVRRLLLKSCDELDARGWDRLTRGLREGDPDGAVWACYQLKEILRDSYRQRDVDAASAALDVFYDYAARSGVPECRRLAGTIRRWHHDILAGHVTGGPRTDLRRASTWPSSGSSASAAASPTSTTTGSACSCTPASPGTLPRPQDCEPALPAQLRRPSNPSL